MKFLLVAGGILQDATLLLRKIAPAEYGCIIAVDRGYDHCLALGLTPHLLMGDLDSIAASPAQMGGVPIIQFPPEKDETDLRLAVDYACAHSATAIDIICATGGRLDQFMGNVSLLEHLQQTAPALPARMLDEGNVIRLLTPALGLQHFANCSKYISIIPLSEEICFSGEGLKYPAHCLTVARSNMVSISNEAIGDSVVIELHSGKAYLILAD